MRTHPVTDGPNDNDDNTPGGTGPDVIGLRPDRCRPDSRPDTGPDSDPDTPAWGTPDSRPDTGPDTRPDGPADTVSGTGPDTAPDTKADTHFDVSLDDEEDSDPDIAPYAGPVLVEDAEDIRKPIIAEQWRGWANIKVTVRDWVKLTAYRAAWHAVRTHKYLFWGSVYGVVGAGRVLNAQRRWWWLSEQYGLRQSAADTGDPQMWLKLHREVKATRAWRGAVLVAEALAAGIGGPIAWALSPGWAHVLAAGAAAGWLAHFGRPADRPILTPATVTPRLRRLNPDIVLRAYYAAGLGKEDKPHLQVTFGNVMSRDTSNTGSQVPIDLPYGKTFADALNAKGAIASGLDVSVNQVFLTPDPSSNRRHTLFVADRDPLAIPAGRTPMLDLRPRNIWDPVPFGLDERGKLVAFTLMWISVLIGAQPRKGKTFAARLLALYAALDPWVKLFVVDGKVSPDWRKFALAADTMVYGTHPGRDGDPVQKLLHLLRDIKKHIIRVNEVLSDLPVSVCPEGKLTRELARDPKYPDLRVWMLVMEEFQVYYELDDKEASTEIASLLSYIMAVGPSAGVILVSSSQKPSGIGAGQEIAKLFTRYRDNHAARFALRCGNRNVSESILGGDAYAEGFDASTLPNGDNYRGVGYLYGLTDHTPTVRTFLADHEDAEKILIAARAHREKVGTLSGEAAGEVVIREIRDVLADARAMLAPAETGIHWTALAERLADRLAEHYADLTPEAVSSQLRSAGVPSVNIKRDGMVAKGCKTADLEAAITRRASA
jgi:S-DNA-T family DNA segregation ATPase FtsK/SpoIIIE